MSYAGRNDIGFDYIYSYPSIIMGQNIEQTVCVQILHSSVQPTITDVSNSNNINDDYHDMPPLETPIYDQNLKRKFTEE